jgi:hypothetical protein
MRLLLRKSNARWRRVFWRELLQRYSEFRREGNFPESKLSGFCSGGIQNTQSTSGNRFFLLWRYSIHAEHHVGVMSSAFFLSVLLDRQPCTTKLLNSLSINPPKTLCACSPCFISRRAKSNTAGAKLLCGKSSSFCKSRAKVHPDGCHFEKI